MSRKLLQKGETFRKDANAAVKCAESMPYAVQANKLVENAVPIVEQRGGSASSGR